AAVQGDHPGGILTRKPLRREDGDTARLLHRLTSYEPEREWTTPVDDPHVLQDFTPNDLEMLPAQWKSYPPGLPALDLPHDWPSVEVPATEVLAGRNEASGRDVDLAELARVLHLSAGVVRVAERPSGQFFFRAAGSAGGRFPLELYVAAHGVDSLPDGVHWYDPGTHALLQVGPPTGGEATTLVVT